MLPENDLIGVELRRESRDERVEDGFVGCLAAHPVNQTTSGKTRPRRWKVDARLEDHLSDSLGAERVEVGVLVRRGLFEERLALDIGGHERGALVGVLVGDVAADRAALVQDEAVVILYVDAASMNTRNSVPAENARCTEPAQTAGSRRRLRICARPWTCRRR